MSPTIDYTFRSLQLGSAKSITTVDKSISLAKLYVSLRNEGGRRGGGGAENITV